MIEDADVFEVMTRCKAEESQADFINYTQILSSYQRHSCEITQDFIEWCDLFNSYIEQWDTPVSLPEELKAFFDNFAADDLARSYYLVIAAQTAIVMHDAAVSIERCASVAKYVASKLSLRFSQIISARIKQQLEKKK